MEEFSNATFFRQIALQNLQRKNLAFSETELYANPLKFSRWPDQYSEKHSSKNGLWLSIHHIFFRKTLQGIASTANVQHTGYKFKEY